MNYMCPKCSAELIRQDDKFICEYCKSEYDLDYFNSTKTWDFIIPFEISNKDALNIYNKNIKVKSLTPKVFKKDINIEKIYVPCYLYDIKCSGESNFEATKVSTWRSDGINYKKVDTYNLKRGGTISAKDVLTSSSSMISSSLLNEVGPYDYNRKVKYDKGYLEDIKVYDEDLTKQGLIKEIQNYSKEIFSDKMKTSIVGYSDVQHLNSEIKFDDLNRTSIFIPLWVINVYYNNTKNMYLINGQNGNIYGNVPLKKKKIIYIWIIVFMIVFTILLLLSLYEVIL